MPRDHKTQKRPPRDVVICGLMRAAAEASAIDEQGLAVRRNQQKGIALATSMASISSASWG